MAATALGTTYDDVQCAIKIAGLELEPRVLGYKVTEELSALFRYAVDVATSPDDVRALKGALGKDVSFRIERDGAFARGVHGIVTAVSSDRTYVAKEQVRTTLVIEPRLANLKYTGGFRIFQRMSAKQIIAELVKPEHIDVVWRALPELPAREYRTQLDESDFDFIARLAADEGAHFFFETTEAKTTLVFTNDPRGFHASEGASPLPFCETEGTLTTEHVRKLRCTDRVCIGAVEERDYDFTAPRFALVARSETSAPQSEANTKRREWREYPGGFTDPAGEGKQIAAMRLEELRSEAVVLEGAASTLRFVAGRKFTLTGHEDPALNAEHVLTFVTMEAGSDGPGLTTFRAVPAETRIRPKRRPKPTARLQTARVVGPQDGDPSVDAHGRIHVQFMWDCDGKFDAHSSCAIRMATPNAHADEGFWMAHRAGSEVLVDFIDGDIDRPVVILALYNGKEVHPYKQPGGVTRSTWKARGIPGGMGFNEITFENSSGSEQIILHAQKDLNETILHDHNETIGENQTSGVGKNQSTTIGNDRTLQVGNNDTIQVGSNQSTTIGANQTDAIGASRTTTVGGNDATTVTGNATRMVGMADTVIVAAARSVAVGAADTLAVAGARSKTIAGSETTTVMGDRTETVGGDESVTVGGGRQTSVTNDDALTVGETIAIEAGKTYTLKVGDDASVTLTKDGAIELKTGDSSFSMAKDGTIRIKGKDVAVEASSDMEVTGQKTVTIKGKKVLSN